MNALIRYTYQLGDAGLTLESLRCLCAVVDEGSFHAAARRLHRSQPAISHQVRALERETGCPLINRRTARATLPGEEVYARGKRLIADADNLLRAVSSASGEAPTEIRVGCSDTTALYLLPKAVREFARSNPATRLRLLSRSTDELIAATKRGDLDVAIVTLPIDDDELASSTLGAQRFVLVAPAVHALAKRKRIRLSTIADLPYLQLDPSTRTGQVLRAHLRDAGISPPVAVDSGSFEVIKRYVAEGVGVALLPEIAMARREKGLVAISVPELPVVEFGAVWQEGGFRNAAAESFLGLVTSAADSG